MSTEDKIRNKKIPLNFRNFHFTQHIAGIYFVIAFTYIIAISDNMIFLKNLPLKVSPIFIVVIISLLSSQLYVYGIYITNTIKDILIPLAITTFCLVVDIIFLFVGKNVFISYTPKVLIIDYLVVYINFILLLLVYNFVEYKEIKYTDILENKLDECEHTENNEWF